MDDRTPEAAKKTPKEILDEETEAGKTEIERDDVGTAVSSLTAGLEVGFGVLVMAVLMTLFADHSRAVRQLAGAVGAPLGFVLVILGRSELFTEHTAVAVLPFLDRQVSLRALARLWGIVYSGNLAGALLVSLAFAWLAPALGVVDPAVFGEISHRLIDHPALVILGSAIAAGWLMGLLSWLVTASRDTIGQLVMIFLVIGTITIVGLHHSVLGSVEVLVGLFSAQGVTAADFVRFLIYATVGNAVGGVVFVALLKYWHASRSAGHHGRTR